MKITLYGLIIKQNYSLKLFFLESSKISYNEESSESNDLPDLGLPKRKRGRPKKKSGEGSTNGSSNGSIGEEHTTKRKRGRPKLEKTSKKEGKNSDSDDVGKKGRGRPRKQSVDKERNSPKISKTKNERITETIEERESDNSEKSLPKTSSNVAETGVTGNFSLRKTRKRNDNNSSEGHTGSEDAREGEVKNNKTGRKRGRYKKRKVKQPDEGLCGFCRKGENFEDRCGDLHQSDVISAHYKCMVSYNLTFTINKT